MPDAAANVWSAVHSFPRETLPAEEVIAWLKRGAISETVTSAHRRRSSPACLDPAPHAPSRMLPLSALAIHAPA